MGSGLSGLQHSDGREFRVWGLGGARSLGFRFTALGSGLSGLQHSDGREFRV